MYDFLLQEEWWMETIAAALITAGATLLVAYLAYADKINKIVRELERMKELLDTQNNSMKEDTQKRIREHDGLSGEHKTLSAEHKELSAEHKELSIDHDKIKEDLNKIYLNQERDKASREAANKSLPDESGLVNMAKTVLNNNLLLQKQNAKLSTQIQLLQKENQQLKVQIRSFETVRDESVKLDDMDLFSDAFDEPEL